MRAEYIAMKRYLKGWRDGASVRKVASDFSDDPDYCRGYAFGSKALSEAAVMERQRLGLPPGLVLSVAQRAGPSVVDVSVRNDEGLIQDSFPVEAALEEADQACRKMLEDSRG